MTTFYIVILGVVELGDNMDATLAPNYYLTHNQFNF